jgi:hypothetical protein
MPVPDSDREMYELVVRSVIKNFPGRPSAFGDPMSDYILPTVQSDVFVSIDLRRLDEAIRDESETSARKRMFEVEVDRLGKELRFAGRPTGVTPAILILAINSLLGIVAPVVVIAAGPKRLADAITWTLVALFVVGLVPVLGYMLWYAKGLNAPPASEGDAGVYQPPGSSQPAA